MRVFLHPPSTPCIGIRRRATAAGAPMQGSISWHVLDGATRRLKRCGGATLGALHPAQSRHNPSWPQPAAGAICVDPGHPWAAALPFGVFLVGCRVLQVAPVTQAPSFTRCSCRRSFHPHYWASSMPSKAAVLPNNLLVTPKGKRVVQQESHDPVDSMPVMVEVHC